MVLIMTMTPLHMTDHGHDLAAVGIVISAHVFGMFALSPISGRLTDRFGPLPIVATGLAMVLGSALLSAVAAPTEQLVLLLALFLLGWGWNLGFVAGSAMLTLGLSLGERTGVQGLADADEYRVHECMTPVALFSEMREGRIYFYADVPKSAPTIRALLAIFTEALNGPLQMVTASKSMLTKINFPREILPLSFVFSNFIHMLLAFMVFFAYLLVIYILDPRVSPFQASIVWLPILLVIHLILTTGFSLLISSLNVFYEDVKGHRAYVLRSALHEPGMAPYLGSLRLAGARDCRAFGYLKRPFRRCYDHSLSRLSAMPCGLHLGTCGAIAAVG